MAKCKTPVAPNCHTLLPPPLGINKWATAGIGVNLWSSHRIENFLPTDHLPGLGNHPTLELTKPFAICV